MVVYAPHSVSQYDIRKCGSPRSVLPSEDDLAGDHSREELRSILVKPCLTDERLDAKGRQLPNKYWTSHSGPEGQPISFLAEVDEQQAATSGVQLRCPRQAMTECDGITGLDSQGGQRREECLPSVAFLRLL
jgi:hypothetical protein